MKSARHGRATVRIQARISGLFVAFTGDLRLIGNRFDAFRIAIARHGDDFRGRGFGIFDGRFGDHLFRRRIHRR